MRRGILRCCLMAAALLLLLSAGCATMRLSTRPALALDMEASPAAVTTPLPTLTPSPEPTASPTPLPTPTPSPEPKITDAWYAERCELLVQNLLRFGDYPDEESVAAAVAAMEIDPNQKMIALTFDDGPKSPSTERILQTLAAHGARATFFILGYRLDQYPGLAEKILGAGCELGNHTMAHYNLTAVGWSKMDATVTKLNERVLEQFGYVLHLLRPPGGSTNGNVRTLAYRRDMAIVRWSVDTLDWSSMDPDRIFAIATTNIKDGDIILFHDTHDTTADAIERIVPELIAQGFQLVTVSELLQCSEGGLVYGESYRHGQR